MSLKAVSPGAVQVPAVPSEGQEAQCIDGRSRVQGRVSEVIEGCGWTAEWNVWQRESISGGSALKWVVAE